MSGSWGEVVRISQQLNYMKSQRNRGSEVEIKQGRTEARRDRGRRGEMRGEVRRGREEREVIFLYS